MKLGVHFSTLLFTAALLSISACSVETVSSKDINPRVIYREYGVTYSEESNNLRTDADFMVGGSSGTHVDLDENADVTAGGIKMNEESHFGKKYFLVQKLDNPFAARGYIQQTIEYTNQNGKKSQQTVQITRLFVRAAPSVLDLTKNYEVSFEIANDFRSGSLVELHIVQNFGNGFRQRFGQVTASKTGKVSIPKEDFQDFTEEFPVDVYVNLNDRYQTKDDASEKAIYIRSSYRTTPLKIQAKK